MADNRVEIAGIFGAAASTFDQVGPRSFAYHGRRLVEATGVGAGERVLDVATGRGACLAPSLERVGPGGLVVGVDLAAAMVRETRAGLLGEGGGTDAGGTVTHGMAAFAVFGSPVRRGNPAFAVMDAQALGLRDATFDRVLCGFAIFFPPDPRRALAEVHRVLRPGGTVGLSLQAGSDPRWGWYRDLLQQYAPRSPYPNDHLFPAGALAALMAETGFLVIEELVEPFEARFRDEEEWWAALWSHGSRGELERMDARTQERFKVEAMRGAAAMRKLDGIPQRRDARMVVGRRA